LVRVQDKRVTRPPHAMIFGEIRLFLLAFLPFKNIEPADFQVEKPAKDVYSSLVSYLTVALLVGVFLLAYGLYPDRQISSAREFLTNLVPEDTTPGALLTSFFESLFYNAAFIGVVFVAFGWVLGAPISRLLGTIRLAVYPSVALLILLWCVLQVQDLSGGWLMVGYLTVGVWWWLDTIAVVIIFHILVRRRMGAHALHPALLPFIEASLGARALSIALQGESTVVDLPVPHWMLAYGPALLVVMMFVAQAAWKHRRFTHGLERALASPGSTGQTARFLACILFMAAGVAAFARFT
jgi:hypothetical protein